MSYYNTYRPQQWAEVIGQRHIVELLRKQSELGAFSHSYLFCGHSGTGKTTMARILAMCLNCQSRNGTGEPCGDCQSCRLIKKGAHWDTYEIDGARFRGIEEIKDLCYKASFSPAGRHKVYLIDECQMLTEPAWNALLKLLEEPPPYLTIILITTEASKIPITVQSRCQILPFKALSPSEIKEKLKRIVEGERIEIDEKYLQFVAESVNGNLRSAENMLEQIVMVRKGEVSDGDYS